MRYNKIHAIEKLCAGNSYAYIEGDDRFIWDENNINPQPTEEEIQAKIAELEAAEPMRLLREERDRRLAATDWRATIDYPGDDQAAWLEYRQALRDITLQDPENVTWPEEPA